MATTWRRRGLGTAMVRAAESFCHQRGVALLTLTTLGEFDPRMAAHAFYLRAGYYHLDDAASATEAPACEGRGDGCGGGRNHGRWGVPLTRFQKELGAEN